MIKLIGKPHWAERFGFIVLALAFLAVVLSVGYMIDSEIRTEPPPAQDQRHTDGEHDELREQEWSQRVARAYAQGQQDAIASMSTTPQGVQLSQACMAWWYGAPIDKAALRQRVCNTGNGSSR